MSGLTDRLRQVAGQAREHRDGMDDLSRDHYRMPPPGAFVGEHTGFVVVHPVLVERMLDVIAAAEEVREYGFDCHGNLEDALARFREVAG